jgi:hypothetical protein
MPDPRHKSTSIFDRLPEGIFRPLGSPNRRHAWDLLVHLYDQFFSPDAPPVDVDGLLHRTVTMEIERFILNRADWIDEEGEETDTPLNGRANLALARLVECGWLREERAGVRTFLDMHPTVQKFLELLWQFAEEGPQLIGGKVQLIHNQLVEVDKNPSLQAVGFSEAAKQARQLISLLKNTTVRVKDVLASLADKDSTSAYIAAFFNDYISTIFIRDYHELRTDNHPLRHRFDILRIVYELRDNPEKRAILVASYRTSRRLATDEEAEELFEKDVSRFLLFTQIETFLDRLDSSINRATSRAIAYINYSLRTRSHLDRLIKQSIESAVRADEAGLPIMAGLPSGQLFSEQRLREAREPSAPPQRTSIRKREMTTEQRAIIALHKAMTRRREITAKMIRDYLDSQIQNGVALNSDTLQIKSVSDLVAYASLSRLGMGSRRQLTRIGYPLAVQMPNIQVTLERDNTTENDYLIVPKFTVQIVKGK